MCGIIGLVGRRGYHINQLLYDGLTVLQHRGQDAAGMMTEHEGRYHLRKSNGLVKDVFFKKHMQNLLGSIGIGHVRYPTAGSSSAAEAQPFYVNYPFGISLAHNGNLTNANEIKELLQNQKFLNKDLQNAKNKIAELQKIAKRYQIRIVELTDSLSSLTIINDSVIKVNKTINWKKIK